MLFGDAFSYPFKSLAKVFTIVLGFAILIAVLVVLIINTQNANNIFTFGIIIAQALFLTGYGIRVIRELMDGSEDLPSLEIASDIGRGIIVTIAGICYFLPLILVVIVVAFTQSILLAVILIIPIAIYLSWGFMVGMVRFAAEDNSGTLFDFGTNFKYVGENKGKAFSLTAYMFLLGIVYGVLTFIVNQVYSGLVLSSISLRSGQMVIVAAISISYILSITLSLFQQFAGLHLMYQFARNIGIERYTGKAKTDQTPNPNRYDG